MRTLHIITACSRFERLRDLAQNVTDQLPDNFSFLIRWHVAFQHKQQFDLCGTVKMNEMIELIPPGDWIWILDDDNEVHPDFFSALNQAFDLWPEESEQVQAIVFSQNRWDVLGPVLEAKPENMRVGGVDTAQVVFKKALLGDLRLGTDNRVPDGILYGELFRRCPSVFVFTKAAVVNFNATTRPKE